MTESIERPEGAIPMPTDSPEPEQPEETSSSVQIGEPLPVGAYQDGPPAEEPKRIPGLPKPADAIDETLAAEHQRYIDSGYGSDGSTVRPDLATVTDARSGAMASYDGRGVREGLLRQVALAAADERTAVRGWAGAVREREEYRDDFLRARETREQAESAIIALGLDIEDDHETIEAAPEPVVIPDDMIK